MAINMLDWHYPRNELAQAYLQQLRLGISNSITLFAERRKGKTEFLMRDMLPAAEEAGYRVVYASMWAARQDPALVLCAALAEAKKPNSLSERIADLFNSPIKSIELEAEFFSLLKAKSDIAFSENHEESTSTLLAIPDLLDMLIKRAKPGKVLLMLDEVQYLAKPQFEDFVSALRTALDLRREHVQVIYTGSSRVRLQKLFESVKAPLFQASQTTNFPNLDEDFVKFMGAQYKKACGRKLDVSHAWDGFQYLSCNPGLFRDALNMAILNVEDDIFNLCRDVAVDAENKSGYEQIWQSLKDIDRAILMLVIDKKPLYTKESVATLANEIGISGAIPATQVQNRVNRLVDEQILISKGRGRYEIEASAFHAWIQRMKSGDLK